MKRIAFIFAACCLITAACAQNHQNNPNQQKGDNMKKTLVVYFSATGTANDRVRQLLAERNDQRSAQIMGELKVAREATDRAHLTLVRLTNAYALLNPDVESAQKLVALVSEDLEYFRKHAMAPSHRDKKTPEPDDTPATPGETPAEA